MPLVYIGEEENMANRLGTYQQLLHIHNALSTTIGGADFLPLKELARRCKISEHTADRRIKDIRAFLQKRGVGKDCLRFSHKNRGYYYTIAVPPPVESALTPQEQTALALLSEVVSAFKNTPFDAAMRNALKKVRGIAPETPTIYTQEGPMYFCLPQSSQVDDSAIAMHFQPLREAITTGCMVELPYYEMRDKQVHRYRVEPYHLFCGQGNWYLYANCPELKRRGDFALQRIRGMVRLLPDHRFTPPAPQQVIAKLRQRFGLIEGPLLDVAIRFLPGRAEWVRERCWHPSQRFEEQPDGSVILHMQCEGLPSLTRWVLGFGGQAIPLAPRELIDAVTREVQQLHAMFIVKHQE